MRHLNKNKNRAISILEALIYIAIFSLLISAVTFGSSMMLSSYQKMKTIRQIETSALTTMDRMVRDIKNATSIDMTGSVFDTSSGSLALISGGIETKYYLSQNRIYVDEDGSVLGPLTPSTVTVSSLVFRYIDNENSEAVKIEMVISGASSTILRNFYNTAVLRGSY